MPFPSLVPRRWRLSPRLFTLLATLAVVAVALIIVTGAAVRLTGSGLGCADWPTCSAGHVVAPLQYHAWMEFGNRLVTGAVSVAIAVAVLGSMLRRPRRRDLIWLSWGMVGGLVAQIVLGGETVRHHLAPQFVMSHFLLSIVLLADAVILRHRSTFADEERADRPGWARPGGRPARRVSAEHVVMGRLLLVATAVVVTLGTVVTSTGPHGGDPNAPRFDFSLHDIAQLHGTAVEIYLFFCLVMLWSLHRAGVPRDVLRRGEWLLVTLVAQAGVGYAQYFSGDPALLVGFHVTGAVLLTMAVLWFNLGLTQRVPLESGEPLGAVERWPSGAAATGTAPAVSGAAPASAGAN